MTAAITKAYYMQLCAEARTLGVAEQPYVLASLLNVMGGGASAATITNLLNALQTYDGGVYYGGLANEELSNTPLDIAENSEFTGKIGFLGGSFYNPNAVPVFLKFYTIAAQDVTVGTTAVYYSFMVPALGQVILDSTTFYTVTDVNLSFACVTGYADSSGAAPLLPIKCYNVKYNVF